uniref:Uncharacterized protein n=1 Tax=Aegilops tauschii subsp. strangulata TaxID=200361 RepID=A0A453G247_AEGTS
MWKPSQLGAEQRGGAGGAVHQPGRVPDAGGEEAEQGRRRLPRQHPVAEELLAPRLTCPSAMAPCPRRCFYGVFAAEFVCLACSMRPRRSCVAAVDRACCCPIVLYCKM